MATGGRSSSRGSVCFTGPHDPPLTWWSYRNTAGHPVFENELEACLDQATTQLNKLDWEAQVDQRFIDAAHGLLTNDGELLVPVATNPDLYELRWQWKDRRLRVYHHEEQGRLVALLAHWKSIDGDADTIRQRQQAQMDLAGRRLLEYQQRPTVHATQLHID